MNTIDLTIDEMDVKILFAHTQQAYFGYTFEMFYNECKGVYVNQYLPGRENPKTFSQWINAQIIALTS